PLLIRSYEATPSVSGKAASCVHCVLQYLLLVYSHFPENSHEIQNVRRVLHPQSAESRICVRFRQFFLYQKLHHRKREKQSLPRGSLSSVPKSAPHLPHQYSRLVLLPHSPAFSDKYRPASSRRFPPHDKPICGSFSRSAPHLLFLYTPPAHSKCRPYFHLQENGSLLPRRQRPPASAHPLEFLHSDADHQILLSP